ncbi:ECF transporter S component [Metabacillus sp. cB07]|uniref:ECF transporter S component n=1 Tax=Metabacillus sp. cB07 TaxID=2806989 RepID=UPI0019396F3F|nr:ECF transporter S component [Metabacillus sp. cB07]
MQQSKVKKQVSIAMLASVGFVLMIFNFPIGFSSFLELDFGDVPAIIAAILYGPGAGIMVEALKNVLQYIIMGNAAGVPVGQLANFTAGVLYILPASYLYRRMNSMKGLAIGLSAGTVLMAGAMSVLNYYLFIPAYTWFLNAPAMAAPELKALIVSGILPFNLIKGIVMGFVFMAIFAKLKTWVHAQNDYKRAA